MKQINLLGDSGALYVEFRDTRVSINADLITVETHGHYRKQLTTTSYTSHNVKNVFFFGGGVPGPSIITMPILLHGYSFIHINVWYKEAI